MEIDELKDIWKKQSDGFKRKDESELAVMLKGKSTSIIAGLKRNVWFELIFTFLGAIGLLAYAVTLPDGAFKWTPISILILFCVYSFYYFKKLRLLSRFDTANENLRVNLRTLVTDLKGYLKFYKRSYSLLYPLYFFLGLFFTAIDHGTAGFFQRISKPEIFIPLLLGAIVFFVFTSWLTRWYLKKLYGNHLEKLEAILRELEV